MSDDSITAEEFDKIFNEGNSIIGYLKLDTRCIEVDEEGFGRIREYANDNFMHLRPV